MTQAVAVPDSVPDNEPDDQLLRLRQFRQTLYDCFTAWPDTLFETLDALLSRPDRPESLAHLSLEPAARRGHGSLYAALDKGSIDTHALADTLATTIDPTLGLVFAVDCSHYPRPDAVTSPGRTFNYDAAKDEPGTGGAPVTAGWWFSVLAATGTSGSSWTTPLDARRVGPTDSHNRVALAQIRALVARLAAAGPPPTVPIVCVDGGYSPAYLGQQLAGTPVQLVARIRSDSVMFGDPPPRAPGTLGRPQVHGERMKLSDHTTWPQPDRVTLVAEKPRPGKRTLPALSVVAWHGLHPRHSEVLHEDGNDPHRNTARQIVRGTVVLIRSADRRQKPIWLFWSGPEGSFDLDLVWRAYLRRFDIEQLFRFLKQYLSWTLPRLRTPDQTTRWTWLVLAAYAHLVLAKDIVAAARLPWERAGSASPLRVKRGFRRLAPDLGTPARPPKPSRPGPGRPTGSISTPAPRYTRLRKATKI
jgi:hypothetical protein